MSRNTLIPLGVMIILLATLASISVGKEPSRYSKVPPESIFPITFAPSGKPSPTPSEAAVPTVTFGVNVAVIVPTKGPLTPPKKLSTKATIKPTAKYHWSYDSEVSWYGPGLYGNGTACGQKYTKTIVGVAHRTLPCGTKVAFRYHGTIVIARVIDRGPYVSGRQFDLSHGLCVALKHCFTGPIDYDVLTR